MDDGKNPFCAYRLPGRGPALNAGNVWGFLMGNTAVTWTYLSRPETSTF